MPPHHGAGYVCGNMYSIHCVQRLIAIDGLVTYRRERHTVRTLARGAAAPAPSLAVLLDN